MALRPSLMGVSGSVLLLAGFGFVASLVVAQTAPPAPLPLDQGADWTPARRDTFYSLDQGSELIPLAWARALEAQDGTPFLADGLTRYGYLANPASPDQLPVGFTVDTDDAGIVHLGLTCAACHTREIVADGQRYRIDGAPAISDFQGFLTDLYQAVAVTLASPARFDRFAQTVLGPNPSPADIAGLRTQLGQWDQREGHFFRTVLPQKPWGVGRLDAVSMIFDRVSGLDIGNTPPDADRSLYVADAPVRYPFIWDAPRQDKTQWPGFAANGDNLFALSRNLGEVYGVFAHFEVKPAAVGHRFLDGNSAKFDNLIQLEDLVGDIGAPKWPWPIDEARRARGEHIFEAQCASCHDVKKTTTRLIPARQAWVTPLADVGTDTHEHDILERRAATGVLRTELVPPLGRSTKQFTLLKTVVVHSIFDQFHDHPATFAKLFPATTPAASRPSATGPEAKAELKAAYDDKIAEASASKQRGSNTYEARHLRGIWATAPYLHNGSVQSLAQLLTPDTQRIAAFPVGPAFDRDAVGMAARQPGVTAMRVTTGRAAQGSGECRCGHNYGTTLGPDDKRDLLEYLKTL